MGVVLCLFCITSYSQIPNYYGNGTWQSAFISKSANQVQLGRSSFNNVPVIKSILAVEYPIQSNRYGPYISDINFDNINDLLIAEYNNNFRLLDGSSSSLQYQLNLPTNIPNSTPVIAEADIEGDGTKEIIIFCSGGNSIYVLDAITGSVEWSHNITLNNRDAYIAGYPMLEDINSDGYLDILVGINHYWNPPNYNSNVFPMQMKVFSGRDYSELWTWSSYSNWRTSESLPLVYRKNNDVYVYFNLPDSIYCLNGRTGTTVWTTFVDDNSLATGIGNITLEPEFNNPAIIYNGDEKCYKLNALTGNIQWECQYNSTFLNTNKEHPVIVDVDWNGTKDIVLPYRDKILMLDYNSGIVTDQFVLPGSILSSLVVADMDTTSQGFEIYVGMTYQNVDYGVLFSSSLDTLWRFPIGSYFSINWSGHRIANVDDDDCLEIIIPVRADQDSIYLMILDNSLTSSDCGKNSHPVVANFEYDITTTCDSSCYHFYNTSEGYVTSFNWSFQNATPLYSTLENPGRICFDSVGTYVVQLTASSGNYSDSLVQQITITNNTFPDSVLNDSLVCFDPPLELNAQNSGSEFTWMDGNSDPLYTANENGIYWVDIKNGTCVLRDSAFIIFGLPQVKLPLTSVFCENDSIMLDAGNPYATSFLWNTGDTTQVIYPTNSGSYSVSVTSCSEIIIQQTEVYLVDSTGSINLYYPNVFTPNNDGINDEFWLSFDNDIAEDLKLTIYNRYGNLMFETQSLSEKWNALNIPDGTYYWVLTYSMNCDTPRHYRETGFINLFR